MKYNGNTQHMFRTTAGGYRQSVSVNAKSSPIGKGFDLIICDDSMSPNEYESVNMREHSIAWHRGNMFSRFNNPKEGHYDKCTTAIGIW